MGNFCLPVYMQKIEGMRFQSRCIQFGNQKRKELLCIWVTLMLVIPQFFLLDLMSLLRNNLGASWTRAASYVNLRDAMTASLGLWDANMFEGSLTNYGIIFFSSLPYLSGLILLAVNPFNRLFVGGGLALISLGQTSLINSCNQLECSLGISSDDQRKRSSTLVTIIKFAAEFINVALVVYLPSDSNNYVERMKFLASAITMALIPAVTLCYLNRESSVPLANLDSMTICPEGNIDSPKINFWIRQGLLLPVEKRVTSTTNIPRVLVAALLKRRLSSVPPYELHENQNAPSENKMQHTSGRLSCLDKAAIRELGNRSKWLCTVTQVEEAKRLLRMVPICTTFLLYGMVKSIGNTFFLEEAIRMDTKILGRDFPPAAFLSIAEWSSLLTQIIYSLWIQKHLRGTSAQYAPIVTYTMGMVLCTLCCSAASWSAMEVYRPNKDELKSVFWLTPQFVIFGAMKGLTRDGIEGFYSEQLPPSMKRYAPMCAETIIGVGSLFATILVLILRVITDWCSDGSIQLEKFYHLLTVLGVGIFFLYCFFVVRYHYSRNNITEEDRNTTEQGNDNTGDGNNTT